MLTTCYGSNPFKAISPEVVNDLHVVVSDFSKSCRNQITIQIYLLKKFEINHIFNVEYSVNFKYLILSLETHWL